MTVKASAAAEAAMERAVCFTQQTSQHMLAICSKKMGTGKGMSMREVEDLLNSFKRLAFGLDEACEVCQDVYVEIYEHVKEHGRNLEQQTNPTKAENQATSSAQMALCSTAQESDITKEELEAAAELHGFTTPEHTPM